MDDLGKHRPKRRQKESMILTNQHIPAKAAGKRRRLQEPSCPVDGRDPKLGETIAEWLSVVRQNEGRQCKDRNNQDYNDKNKRRELKEMMKNKTEPKYFPETPEPVDLVASKTYMYISSDYEEPLYSGKKRRSAEKCSERKYRRLPEEEITRVLYSGQYRQPEVASGITYPVGPVDTKTYTSVSTDHNKPRRRRRKRKNKQRTPSNIQGQDNQVTSLFHDLTLTAWETHRSVLSDQKKPRKKTRRKRKTKKGKLSPGQDSDVTSQLRLPTNCREGSIMADINFLTYKLSNLSLDTNKMDQKPKGIKRKLDDVLREEMISCDDDTLGLKMRKLSII